MIMRSLALILSLFALASPVDAALINNIGGGGELIISPCPALQFVRRRADDTGWECAAGAVGGDALTTAGLGQFLAGGTTSAQLAGQLSDETGIAGGFVRATTPTIISPTIASFGNANHTHAAGSGGGNIPESSVTGLTARIDGKQSIDADVTEIAGGSWLFSKVTGGTAGRCVQFGAGGALEAAAAACGGGGGGSESTTASNLGAGRGVFSSEVGDDLQFNTLLAADFLAPVANAIGIDPSKWARQADLAASPGTTNGTFTVDNDAGGSEPADGAGWDVEAGSSTNVGCHWVAATNSMECSGGPAGTVWKFGDPGDTLRRYENLDNTTEVAAPAAGTTILYPLGGEWWKKDNGDGATERLMLNSGNVSGDIGCDAAGVCAAQDNAIDGTDIAIASQADGDIMYLASGDWVRLPKGTANQELRMNSGATAPEWYTPGGGGTFLLGRWIMSPTSLSLAANCANLQTPSSAPPGACGASRRYYTSRATTLVAMSVALTETVTGIEGCDLQLFKNGASESTAEILLGGTALDAVGETQIDSTMSISLSAGDYLELKWEDPTVTTQCPNATGCDCDAISVTSAIVELYAQ